MYQTPNILLTEIRHLLGELGAEGGMIGPSIYDTAQVLRLAPPTDAQPVVVWLLEQQQCDGGWGDPVIPRTRMVPTLAAVLALQPYLKQPIVHEAVQHAVMFLRENATIWEGPLPEDLPVGIELLLPHLLQEAALVNLEIPQQPFEALIALGLRRRQMIAARPQRAGTPAVHSWEAWGVDPDPALLDGSGGIGHSPAATAAWLRAAAGRPDLVEACAAATRYLEASAHATGVGIPGVVPTVWPITWFEQSNALYALWTAGMLDHLALQDALGPQLDALARALRPTGLGMSDWFMADADDTAQATKVLHATGRKVSFGPMEHFMTESHCRAYLNELQAAPSTTAHGVQMLALFGKCLDGPLSYVLDSQRPDGRWLSDKWHSSWLFTTSQVVLALREARHTNAFAQARRALLDYQRPDGGWGIHQSNAEETAFGVLTLRALLDNNWDAEACKGLRSAERWLINDYQPFRPSSVACWIGKENYRPLRLSRMIELVATLPGETHG